MDLTLEDHCFWYCSLFLVFLIQYATEIDTVPVFSILSWIERSLDYLNFFFLLLCFDCIQIFRIWWLGVFMSSRIWFRLYNILTGIGSFHLLFLVGFCILDRLNHLLRLIRLDQLQNRLLWHFWRGLNFLYFCCRLQRYNFLLFRWLLFRYLSRLILNSNRFFRFFLSSNLDLPPSAEASCFCKFLRHNASLGFLDWLWFRLHNRLSLCSLSLIIIPVRTSTTTTASVFLLPSLASIAVALVLTFHFKSN
jgi:hypothetical protein